MFDRIAARYDLLNRLLTAGLDRRWRARLVELVVTATQGRGAVLDLATGTADVVCGLRRAAPRLTVVGVDPSVRMLRRGVHKLADPSEAWRGERSARARLLVGDGETLPFAAAVFAATCCSFGIRNVPDRSRALRELHRVTRSGGVVAILEASEPAGGLLAPLARFHLHELVPRLGAWLGGDPAYGYLQRSIAAFPAPADFCAMLGAAGFEDVRAERLSFGAAHLFAGSVQR